MKNRLENQFEGFLSTSSLWKGTFYDLKQFEFPEIKIKNNLNILSHLPSLATNFVLGKRMESFFELMIRHSSTYKLLAHNIQISKEKITLGELDFLLKNLQNKQVSHIEMVYKFYVYDPSFSSEMQRWIGPNRRDTLLQKAEKLKEKQFPLLFKPETKNLLNSLGLDSAEILQQTCFKAHLFVPKKLQDKYFSHINNKCIAGTWLHFKDFTSAEYRDFKFYAPKKQDWPILPKHGETWYNHSEIIKQIEILFKKNKSPLIWVKKPGNTYERTLVVWW
jgi:hypothetical protein